MLMISSNDASSTSNLCCFHVIYNAEIINKSDKQREIALIMEFLLILI